MGYIIKKSGKDCYFNKNLGINWNHWSNLDEAKRYSTKAQVNQVIRQYKLKNVVIEKC